MFTHNCKCTQQDVLHGKRSYEMSNCLSFVTNFNMNLRMQPCCGAHVSNYVECLFCVKQTLRSASFDFALLDIERLFFSNTIS